MRIQPIPPPSPTSPLPNQTTLYYPDKTDAYICILHLDLALNTFAALMGHRKDFICVLETLLGVAHFSN